MSTQPPPIGMSAPPPPPPPPPPSSSRKGCFIAVGVVLLLVVVVCLGLVVSVARNPTKFAAWGSSVAMKQAEGALGSDVSPELRKQFHDESEAYLAWLRGLKREEMKQMGPQQIQAPLTHLQEAMKDRIVSADEAQSFVDELRRIRGVAPPPAPSPAETTAPSPEATAPAPETAPAPTAP